MPYKIQYWMALTIAALMVISPLLITNADSLGLDKHMVAWVGVCTGFFGFISGFLPKVTKSPNPDRVGRD